MNGIIERQFVKMGARVVVRASDELPLWRLDRRNTLPPAIQLDIGVDRRGEYFDLAIDNAQTELQVLDVRPRERHLLLMSRNLDTGDKEKFLCGHDERHWFVAAVPPGSTSNVASAMEALKPAEVHNELARRGVRRKNRNRRRTAAFVRQGEWFFVPADGAVFAEHLVLRDEPLRRGSGKPHMVECLARTGGETVYVTSRHPNGLTGDAYQALIQRNPKARRWHWEVMRRDAGVFVKGRVRHPDHRTVVLDGWHRVIMNRETEAPAMRQVAFLD